MLIGGVRIVGQACVRGCGRPARGLGGHCTPRWMGLSGRERALLTWEHPPATGTPLDELEALWRFSEPGPRAA